MMRLAQRRILPKEYKHLVWEQVRFMVDYFQLHGYEQGTMKCRIINGEYAWDAHDDEIVMEVSVLRKIGGYEQRQ